jgi:hypothetical protein
VSALSWARTAAGAPSASSREMSRGQFESWATQLWWDDCIVFNRVARSLELPDWSLLAAVH